MMRVTYIGPSAVVTLPQHGYLAERHGAPIAVDDELGISLCEQTTNWKPADPESQALLDDFYRWVAAHEKRDTIVDGEIVVRWMPRPPEPEPDPAAEAAPVPEPAKPAAAAPRPRGTRSTNSTPTQES